jgi:hypothetical protein
MYLCLSYDPYLSTSPLLQQRSHPLSQISIANA